MLPDESNRAPSSRSRVVVIGAGFGGLYAVKALGQCTVDITVIDRTNHHLFQPMLYQVATGELSGDEIATPIRGILKEQKNAVVLMEEVTGIDLAARVVRLGDASVSYDYLIVATGAEYDYFDHDDWRPFAPSLKTLDNAAAIRTRILQAFERAEQEPVEPNVERQLTFVIVGGGTTGVEMAGAIAELGRRTLKGDYRRIDPAKSKILLVEEGQRLLAGFDARLAREAQRELEKLGVQIRLGTAVTAMTASNVRIGDEEIATDTILWAAGVKASPAAQWLGAEADKKGRVYVNPDLSLPGHPDVFIIGDAASVKATRVNLFGFPIPETDGKAKPLPGVAQPAIQEGQHAARVIRRRVRGLRAPKAFVYRDKGNLAAVGRSFAIADLGKIRLWGLLAWIVWLVVHITYLIGFANRLLVLTEWALAYFTGQRSRGAITVDSGEKVPASTA